MSDNAKDVIRLAMILFVMAVIGGVTTCCLASCSGFKLWVMNRNGFDHEVYGGTFRYVSDKDCPNGAIDDALLSDRMDFNAGEIYYCVYEFNYVSYNNEHEWADIGVELTVSPLSEVSATLQEANTGNYREFCEEDSTRIDLSYKIPEELNVVKHFRIVLKLEMHASSFPYIKVHFTGAEQKSE